jgi:hypothetical protein
LSYSLQLAPDVRDFLFNRPGLSRAGRVKVFDLLNALRDHGDTCRREVSRHLSPGSAHFTFNFLPRSETRELRHFSFVVSNASAVYGVSQVVYIDHQTLNLTERYEEAVMSFDIFFQPCRFTGSPVVKKNPFTGDPRSVLPNEPLSATELKAVQHVLKRANAHGPDEHGCYVVQLDDGGGAEVFGSELATGCMVALGGMTVDLLQFLFDLLKAGNWVMLPAMEDAVAIMTSPGCLKGTPDDFPRVVVCKSAAELGVLLSNGVQAWEKYRDQVVGGEG